MLQIQSRMFEKVNFVRRSMLEGVVGDVTSIAGGPSSTMSQGMTRAQLEKSGYTAGSMQTENGFLAMNLQSGKMEDAGPNSRTYSEWVTRSLGLAQGASRDPAQQLIEEAKEANKDNKKMVEVLDRIQRTLEKGIPLSGG